MFTKLDHVNMTVSNLAESVDWYSKVFGFQKVEGGIGRDGSPWGIIDNKGSALCLWEKAGLNPAGQDDHDRYYGVLHFGFRINDETEWRAKIEKFNLLIHHGPIQYPKSTSWYLRDPSGNEIEVSYTNYPELFETL